MTDVTPAPQDPGPVRWAMPPASSADDNDIVGVGADLAPSTMVAAYRRGIFPWPHDDLPLPWFSPDPRAVIPCGEVHVSRSLRRTLRRSGWTTTVDLASSEVLAGCRDRPGEGTWITDELAAAYVRLFGLGWAHTVEVWDGDDLVGGILGLLLGGIFTGESMFHRRSDASKVALLDLVTRLGAAGGVALDAQLMTDHLASLGASPWPRDRFIATLRAVRDDDVRLPVGRRPVARLVE
jgi:leucyl/phenylalanyl-tRNA--protein transferase